MTKGISGKETKGKQKDFQDIMSHHVNVCNSIFGKNGYGFPYIYIDAFGGPGYINDRNYNGPGSPLIMQEILKNGLSFIHKRFIYEIDYQRYNQLIKHIGKAGVYLNSCTDMLNQRLPIKQKWQYGMLYCDPPMSEKTFWLSSRIMKDISLKYETVDLMFYVSCTSIKRMREAHNKNISLQDLISPINKDWIIRDLRGQNGQQYTFLIGTNFTSWAEWKIRGFHHVDSPQGQIIFNKANGQIKKKKYQQTTFLTEPMKNTSSIPDIELLELKRWSGLKAIVNFVKQIQ